MFSIVTSICLYLSFCTSLLWGHQHLPISVLLYLFTLYPPLPCDQILYLGSNEISIFFNQGFLFFNKWKKISLSSESPLFFICPFSYPLTLEALYYHLIWLWNILYYNVCSLSEKIWLNCSYPIAFTHISLSKNVKWLDEQKIRRYLINLNVC